jgi:hypothetical protein
MDYETAFFRVMKKIRMILVSWICIQNLYQESVSGIRIRIRNPHPESASGIRIRNPHPESAFQVRISDAQLRIWIQLLKN